MNNIAKMELPVSFDSLNDAIVDSKGRTIAIVSWPQCGLDVLTIKERAMFMVERINGVQSHHVHGLVSVMPTATGLMPSNKISESSFITNTKDVLSKVFGKRGRKRIHAVKRPYKWVDGNGVDVKLVGRPLPGYHKVYLDEVKAVV